MRLAERLRAGWLVLPLVALVSGAGCSSGGSPGTSSATPSASGAVQAVISTGQRPGVPAAGAGSIWVPNTGDGTVSRVDPASNRVVATIRIGDQPAFYHRDCEEKWNVHAFMGPSFHVRDCDLPSALAFGAGVLWVLKNDDHTVLRIDPATTRIVARVALGFVPFDIAATDRAVWITGYYVDQVVRVDPSSNQVVARLTVADGAAGVAATDQAVWVASSIAGQLTRIDPVTNTVAARIALPCPSRCSQGSVPLAVVASPDAIWVRTVGDGLLARVDPQTNLVVTTIPVVFSVGRDGQDHLATLNHALWVSGTSLQRIDPQSNRVAGTVDVNVTTVTAGFGSLWVIDVFGRVERINPTA
jgi:YVTN family beta-propeller protein